MYGLPTPSVGVSSIAKGTPPLLMNFRPLSSNGIFFSSLKWWSLGQPVSYPPLTSFNSPKESSLSLSISSAIGTSMTGSVLSAFHVGRPEPSIPFHGYVTCL